MKKLLLIFVLLYGCGEPPVQVYPKYQDGEIVRSVLYGQKGQILRSYCPPQWNPGKTYCLYKVRFAANQLTTNTSLLGSDGPITQAPLMTVDWVKEYELKKE